MNATILIVEDEAKVANVVTKLLNSKGYQTHVIDHGDHVLPWLKTNEVDLILLDVMLPGIDGMALISRIREHTLVPIIMLTAMREHEDQIKGLTLGANDYITKPFSLDNLLARVTTNIQFSMQLKNQQPSTNDGFLVNLDSATASYNGQSLELTHAELRILYALRKHQGQVLSRQQLINEIYDDNRIVSDRTIDTHVKSLRKKLAQTQSPEHVQSVYGKGYKFIASP